MNCSLWLWLWMGLLLGLWQVTGDTRHVTLIKFICDKFILPTVYMSGWCQNLLLLVVLSLPVVSSHHFALGCGSYWQHVCCGRGVSYRASVRGRCLIVLLSWLSAVHPWISCYGHTLYGGSSSSGLYDIVRQKKNNIPWYWLFQICK